MRLTQLLEDLDDKDDFGIIKVAAAYYHDWYGSLYVFEDGAKIYMPRRNTGYKLRTSDGQIMDTDITGINVDVAPYDNGLGRSFMGGWKPFTPDIKADWIEVMGGNLKENLEDQDEFMPDCSYCDMMTAIQGEPDPAFHHAHTAAVEAARQAGQYSTTPYTNAYKAKMLEHGYVFKADPKPGDETNYFWAKTQ